jgi:serine/threonine-protein kinase
LPGGKAVLFTVFSGSLENARIAVQSLETGERRMLLDGAHPRYAPTGHIVFGRVDSLWAVAFDADRLDVTSSPTPVLEGVQVNTGGLANFALASDGSLVYVPGETLADDRLVWVDREGDVTTLTEKRGSYRYPRLSPDGQRLAVEFTEGGRSDVWIHDLGRDTLSRLTTEGGRYGAAWSPDGSWVAFSSRRGSGSLDLYRKRADFSGPAEVILTKEYSQYPLSWSPDGTLLTYMETHPTSNSDLWILPLEGGREPRPIIQTSSRENWLTFSADGLWIAYMSDESGQHEVYAQPFPGPGRRIQISTDGGRHPVWSASGRELFYLNGQSVMSVEVETEPEFRPGTPRLLFEGSHKVGFISRQYDVAPDGQRFVMIQPEEQPAQDQLVVVLNWFEELKRLAPTN